MKMEVSRSELIEQLMDKYKYTKKAAKSLVEDFTEIILDNMACGNTVTIMNFGTFEVVKRNSRMSPNVYTGEMQEVKEHHVPRFVPSKKMKYVVKEWEDSVNRGLG